MESTRPIRALMRGLDALTVLNLRDGATVSEVAHEIRLPRTTVYRILETLGNAGFIFRDPSDDRYRLTIMVRSLSAGFDDDAWVTQIAKPMIDDLGREMVWPISIATLSGTSMIIRETTDHSSPLAIERYSAGHRAPLLSTATGRIYLSFCPAPQRDSLLESLARTGADDDRLARAPRQELLRMFAQIKAQGYATTSRARRLVEETSIGAPVLLGDRVLACLTVRFAASAISQKAAIERFFPRLKQCAARIGAAFLEQQAEAQHKGVPERAA